MQGSNMAECHPVAYRFVMEARERGATVIHVDPRYTRTSATANIYAPIRSGTDIVFLGGLINYVLQNELYFKEYVVRYTNAPFLVNENFKGADEGGGLFSGFEANGSEEGKPKYDPATWQYDRDENGVPLRDESLLDPQSVFQLLKRHFARYTPEMVADVCGTPRDVFLQVARSFAANSGRDKTGSFIYAVGLTHHSTGVQMIRAAAILQLLLGNVGRPGGGILALRGHATIQGSTDIPTLYNMLPGYLNMPLEPQTGLQDYLKANYAPTGWWHNLPKYVVSLLKAWYGENATAENNWLFDYLPKLDGDYSYNQLFFNMQDGKIKGLFVMGENLAVGGINARLETSAMQKLDWCVVRDLFPVETGDFWQDGVDPRTVGTEVFLMPAAAAPEKDGSYTNTQRLVQWHDKAVEPPGDATSETWFIYYLGKRLIELYAGSELERDRPIRHLQWDLPTDEHGEPDLEPVVREISGYTVAGSVPVKDFSELKDDGTTACGAWIYSGIMGQDGTNKAKNRQADPTDAKLGDPRFSNHANWGFSWPANRRILYNRAAADPDGKPWSENKKLVWWDAAQNAWVGHDVPDFPKDKAPDAARQPDGKGINYHGGDAPFIVLPDGVGQLFVPKGLADGPLPAHYEAVESPVRNRLYRQRRNPLADAKNRPDNPLNPNGAKYPYVVTTYRLTEHHTSGAMSRWIPWLAELQPELFAEIDPVLAREKGLQNGDWATLLTERGELEMRVLVTDRMKPLTVDGATLHQIGLPYHWGRKGLVTGDTVNNMIPLTSEPNVKIHEAKTFTADLRPGKRVARPPSDIHSSDGVTVPSGGEAGHLAGLKNKNH
jgi:formate dehydrogenase major subunit